MARVPMLADGPVPTDPMILPSLSFIVPMEHLTMLVLCPELVSPVMLVPIVQMTLLLSLFALMTFLIWNLALAPLTTLDEMWLPLAIRVLARSRVLELRVLLDVWQLTAMAELTEILSVLVMLWLSTMPFLSG